MSEWITQEIDQFVENSNSLPEIITPEEAAIKNQKGDRIMFAVTAMEIETRTPVLGYVVAEGQDNIDKVKEVPPLPLYFFYGVLPEPRRTMRNAMGLRAILKIIDDPSEI